MRSSLVRLVYIAIIATALLAIKLIFFSGTYAHEIDYLIAKHPVVVFSKSYCP